MRTPTTLELLEEAATIYQSLGMQSERFFREAAARLRKELEYGATTPGLHGPLWQEITERVNGGPLVRAPLDDGPAARNLTGRRRTRG